jgi:hypothetical protein
MDGIINLDINISRLNNSYQAKCLFQTENFTNFGRIMDIKIYNFGHNKEKIG